MLQQAYGEDCVEPDAMSRVVPAFQIGQNSIEDDPKSGRPSTSMDEDYVEKVLSVIRQNGRLTAREVAVEVRTCKSSCHLILTDNFKTAELYLIWNGLLYGFFCISPVKNKSTTYTILNPHKLHNQ